MDIDLSADDVTILMSMLPAEARGVDSGFFYDNGRLEVPEAFEASVSAIMAESEWTAAASTAAFAARRASQIATVDVEAERQRLRWITPGVGQAMTYARKVEEARLLANDANPQSETYPMLAASLGIDGEDLAAVAATILAMDAAWGRIGGAIEARRLRLKRDIGQTTTLAELDLIDMTAGWPA